MSNSFNSALVSEKSFSIGLHLSIILLFFTACNFSQSFEPKKKEIKINTYLHLLPFANQSKNMYLFDYQKNKIEKYSTKKIKDSTDLIEIALESQSTPIMTFVQYSY